MKSNFFQNLLNEFNLQNIENKKGLRQLTEAFIRKIVIKLNSSERIP